MRAVWWLKLATWVGLPVLAVADCAVPAPFEALHLALRIGLALLMVASLAAISLHFSPRWEDVRWKLLAIGVVLLIFEIDILLFRAGLARVASSLGLLPLLCLAFLFCREPRRISLRTLGAGVAMQIVFAVLILFVPGTKSLFRAVADGFIQLQAFTVVAVKQVFGILGDQKAVGALETLANVNYGGVILAIQALTVIIFVGALSRLLYHCGVLQAVVRAMAFVMRRLLGASGAESLSSAANVFVGMVESPLLVRPYVAGMTESELFCVMSAGMATVAGSVMAIYMIFVGTAHAVHLLCASVISAPAAIVVAKLMMPETGEPQTAGGAELPEPPESERPVNAVDAVARGAAEGTTLTVHVTGMLIAFLAFVAMANAILGLTGRMGLEPVTLQAVFGRLFWPVAVLLGIDIGEASQVGTLLGVKTAMNEFLGYLQLQSMMSSPVTRLTEHARVVSIYALCGFANFGSVGIMIAGIGGMAPSRRSDVARLGVMSIVSGSLAAFMTACIAGAMVG